MTTRITESIHCLQGKTYVKCNKFQKQNIMNSTFFSVNNNFWFNKNTVIYYTATYTYFICPATCDPCRNELTFHEAELAASLLMKISRGGDASWHGEEVLSPDGSHWHRPAHLLRWHGSTRREEGRMFLLSLHHYVTDHSYTNELVDRALKTLYCCVMCNIAQQYIALYRQDTDSTFCLLLKSLTIYCAKPVQIEKDGGEGREKQIHVGVCVWFCLSWLRDRF